ncbi:MAG: hypothetical protein NTV34_14260 [Proteobacteria bacterium]|nr:hypothetical protein [Pseudomonadota bacterium]
MKILFAALAFVALGGCMSANSSNSQSGLESSNVSAPKTLMGKCSNALAIKPGDAVLYLFDDANMHGWNRAVLSLVNGRAIRADSLTTSTYDRELIARFPKHHVTANSETERPTSVSWTQDSRDYQLLVGNPNEQFVGTGVWSPFTFNSYPTCYFFY